MEKEDMMDCAKLSERKARAKLYEISKYNLNAHHFSQENSKAGKNKWFAKKFTKAGKKDGASQENPQVRIQLFF